MLKICAIVLLTTLLSAAAASAHGGGGGGAEPMPATNFTDMPRYSPEWFVPARHIRARRAHWRQGLARDR